MARLTPHGGGGSLTPRMRLDGRGPGLLTEDRQKPRGWLDGTPERVTPCRPLLSQPLNRAFNCGRVRTDESHADVVC